MFLKFFVLMPAAALIVACSSGNGSGGGGGDLLRGCQPIAGGGTDTLTSVTFGCAGCEVRDPGRAIDGSGQTFGTLFMPSGSSGNVSLRAVAQSGVVFPAGSRAGMVHSITYGNSTAFQIEIITYLDGEQQESEVFNSGTGSSQQDPSDPGIATFPTNQPYDAVELSFTRTGGIGEVNARVHAFCSN